MTRRQWLELQKGKATVEEKQVRNFAAEDKLEAWIYDHRFDNSGNANWPATKFYLEEKERLRAGLFKTVYNLYPSGQSSFYEITKTEYDYFKSL